MIPQGDLFEAAERARDEGMARAESAAGPEWADEARAWLVAHLRTCEYLFPDDAKNLGCPVPPSGNWRATGPVWKKAAADGLMFIDRYERRASGHCAPSPVWKSLIWGAA